MIHLRIVNMFYFFLFLFLDGIELREKKEELAHWYSTCLLFNNYKGPQFDSSPGLIPGN